MENQIVMLPAEVQELVKNVSVEKRNEVQIVLNQVFNGVKKMREHLDNITVADPADNVNMKLANTIRLGVRQVRLDAEKTFDTKRAEVQHQMISFKTEDSLWLKAKQTMQILTKEIEEKARWKEETKTRFEAEQKELKIQQRITRISKIALEIERVQFENMTDEIFEMFYASVEKQYNDRIEAEQKAERDRIAKEKAEAEERERIRLENERLKAEAEEKEKQIQAERQKAEAERKIIEEKARKEREESDRKLRAEQKAARVAAEKAAAERAKLEAEIKAKNEAEAKARKDADAKVLADQKAKVDAELQAKRDAEAFAKAPIKTQLTLWVDLFVAPQTSIANEKTALILEKFQAFKKWAKNEVDSM